MTKYVKKDYLLSQGMPEEDYTMPDGSLVRIRSLTRTEMHKISGMANKSNTSESEKWGIHYGLVEPSLTPKEVEKWMADSPASTLNGLVEAILALSGISEEDTEKATFRGDGDE